MFAPSSSHSEKSRGRLLVLALAVALVALGLQYRAGVHATGKTVEDSTLPAPFDRLAAQQVPLGPPQPGDWLETHQEPGQTYDDFVAQLPGHLASHGVLYVQPLGNFNAEQRRVVQLTAEYLQAYFPFPVRVLDDLPLSLVPESSRRPRSDGPSQQLNATYILYDVLKPRVPADAVAMIALTTSDLWPGDGWNYVFGLASLTDRVGVWSMHRFGDPAESAEQFHTTLRRTLKVAAHETSHMFGMQHCVYYRCCMNPSNHVREADRLPLEVCAYCLAKLCHATGADPVQRCRALIAFAQAQGLESEAVFWKQQLALLKPQP